MSAKIGQNAVPISMLAAEVWELQSPHVKIAVFEKQ